MYTSRNMITFKPGEIRFTFRVGGMLIHREHVLYPPFFQKALQDIPEHTVYIEEHRSRYKSK